jgi:predicted dehydrogenase
MSGPAIGIVGLGTMGRLHARNVSELGADVVAGADVDEGTRAEFAAEFDADTYESHEDLLDVDAVIVTTPNRFHEEIAVDALEAGCCVLLEKPLAHTLESAERIAEAARRSSGFCMVGFHNRFSPAAATAKAYADAGRLGEITHVEADYVRRRGIPAPGSWFTDEELAGGGALIDVGVHVIDLVLYLLDFPDLVEVTGVTRSQFGDREDYADPDGFGAGWDAGGNTFDVDDSVSAFLRTESGQTISLEVAWATNRSPSKDVVLRGTEAGAALEVGGSDVELYETGTVGIDHHVESTVTGTVDRRDHAAEAEQFLAAVERGEAPSTNTVEEALAVQRVIDAIYRSSRSGRAVPIEPAVAPNPAD